MKSTLRERKNNPQETNREGKEARIQINNLKHKEERNIQPEQKKQKFKKMRRGLGTSGTSPNEPYLNHRDARRRRGRARARN